MRANTDWFRDAKWGVFMHYLGTPEESADDWNRRIDGFDVDALAAQLAELGAGYFFITIGQNSGHYCAPNESYDSIVGIEPSKCSKRDLVSDLYEALARVGIPLMVYLPAGAPDKDPVAMERLGWQNGSQPDYARPIHGLDENGKPWGAANPPNIEFQKKWEAVIHEWSERWGRKVRGWWFDGCYFANAMYRRPEAPNFASFAAAAKAGNPESLVAFNPGALNPVISMTEHEDYTAGELIGVLAIPCPGRWVDGAQYHLLSSLTGSWTNRQAPVVSDELIAAYTHYVNSKKGVMTWDVRPNSDGTLVGSFFEQLKTIGAGVSH